MKLSPDWYVPIIAFLGVVFLAIVGKRAGWFKIISGTNQLLREQNTELRQQNEYLKGQLDTSNTQHDQDKKDWGARHSESLIEIAKLQGKVENLTVIPLRSIDEALKQLVESTKENATTNKRVLRQLQSTAKIAEEDRDVLTNQNVHIRTEVTKMLNKEK